MSFSTNPYLALSAILLLAYLSGSLPFSIWITRLISGKDVREAGSGHATTTNTIRQAGFLAGTFVLVLDIAKGYLPVYIALRLGVPAWGVGLAAAAAVIGHCWPLFAGFRGGMGLATTGGCYLASAPLAFAILLGVLIFLTLTLRHGARASVVMGILSAPILWLFGLPAAALWIGACTGLVLALRFTIDWRREYRELWLDRDPAA
jgi:glycerol-3-phosphate acyltransferase PlsY